MTPSLESCYFGGTEWSRLAAVLRSSAAQHCPSWAIRVRAITTQPYRSARHRIANVANTQKLEEWVRIVTEAPDGDQILLIDTDTMILRPLDDVWALGFDVAYTTKPTSHRLPLNGGVLFVRVSDRVRAFMRSWWGENVRMLGDAAYHMRRWRRYGGINQSALGELLQSGACADLKMLELPCRIWNCEESAWPQFDAQTRILHVKGHLRGAAFRPGHRDPHVERVAKVWRRAEALELRRTA